MTPDPAAPVGLPKTRVPLSTQSLSDILEAANMPEGHPPELRTDRPGSLKAKAIPPRAPVGLDLDALAELLAKATPGPWRVAPLFGRDDEGVRYELAACSIEADSRNVAGMLGGIRAEDAELIVAAVNALPALLDLVSRQRGALTAAIDELDEQQERLDDEFTINDEERMRKNPVADRLRSLLPGRTPDVSLRPSMAMPRPRVPATVAPYKRTRPQ